MKIEYWKNINATLFRKTFDIKDGIKDSVQITIEEEGDIKRKFLIDKNGVAFKLVKQESVIDAEEVITEKHFSHKEFERIVNAKP